MMMSQSNRGVVRDPIWAKCSYDVKVLQNKQRNVHEPNHNTERKKNETTFFWTIVPRRHQRKNTDSHCKGKNKKKRKDKNSKGFWVNQQQQASATKHQL